VLTLHIWQVAWTVNGLAALKRHLEESKQQFQDARKRYTDHLEEQRVLTQEAADYFPCGTSELLVETVRVVLAVRVSHPKVSRRSELRRFDRSARWWFRSTSSLYPQSAEAFSDKWQLVLCLGAPLKLNRAV